MKWFKNLTRCFHFVTFVDKCLVVIMAVLMLQSAYTLFTGEVNQNQNTVDVMVRTSAAAIFGYFISSNFDRGQRAGKGRSENSSAGGTQSAGIQAGDSFAGSSQAGLQPVSTAQRLVPATYRKQAPAGKIGFSAGPEEDGGAARELQVGGAQTTAPVRSGTVKARACACGGKCLCAQDAIVAGIGAVALIMLLAARNFDILPASSAGTISQLRDFVSGCVGFLIGCATGGNEQES